MPGVHRLEVIGIFSKRQRRNTPAPGDVWIRMLEIRSFDARLLPLDRL
jgi:hypothetical protein